MRWWCYFRIKPRSPAPLTFSSNGSPSVLSAVAAEAALVKSLLEMQTLGTYTRPTEQETLGGKA